MYKILIVLDIWDQQEQENFHKMEVCPGLSQAGYAYKLVTHEQASVVLNEYTPDLIVLSILKKQSPCWDLARHVRRKTPKLPILIAVRPDMDASPDNPYYYGDGEYLPLFDSYYDRFDFVEWVNRFLLNAALARIVRGSDEDLTFVLNLLKEGRVDMAVLAAEIDRVLRHSDVQDASGIRLRFEKIGRMWLHANDQQ